MALDIFGNTLYTGDVVVFADMEEGEPTLTVYEVEEVIDNDVLLATCVSGEAIGNSYYLQDPSTRCSLIRNAYKTAELKFKSTIN